MTTIILLITVEGLAKGFSLIGAKKGKSWWHTTTWDVMGIRSAMNHFSRTVLSRPFVCWPSMLMLLAHHLSFMDLKKAFQRAKREQSPEVQPKNGSVRCAPSPPQQNHSSHSTERKDQQIEDSISKTVLTKSFNFSTFWEAAGGDRGDFL